MTSDENFQIIKRIEIETAKMEVYIPKTKKKTFRRMQWQKPEKLKQQWKQKLIEML